MSRNSKLQLTIVLAAATLGAAVSTQAGAQVPAPEPAEALRDGPAQVDVLERPGRRLDRAIDAHTERIEERQAIESARAAYVQTRDEASLAGIDTGSEPRGDDVGQLERATGSLRRELEALAEAPVVNGVSRATLESIAACESGGDPTAISPGGDFRGKYQFLPSTWASVGGSGDPAAAPEAEQDLRAAILYQRDGAGQWPVCGS